MVGLMKIKIKNKEIDVPNVRVVRGLGNLKGLMFSRMERSNALLFNIKSSLHSFFVFYDFIVLWLDKDNKVLDIKKVRPFRFYIDSNSNYNKILEIPINRRYNSTVKQIVGKI